MITFPEFSRSTFLKFSRAVDPDRLAHVPGYAPPRHVLGKTDTDLMAEAIDRVIKAHDRDVAHGDATWLR